MSGIRPIPPGTFLVDSKRFDTQLAAVRHAANEYYTESYNAGVEYNGVIFRDNHTHRYGITVRPGDRWHGATVHMKDAPRGTSQYAVWHTHIPFRAGATTTAEEIVGAILDGWDLLSGFVFGFPGGGLDNFSGDDTSISDIGSEELTKKYKWQHRRFPIYLISPTLIKQYSDPIKPEKVWQRERTQQHQKRPPTHHTRPKHHR